MSNPLFDRNFLYELDNCSQKTTHVRLISLDQNDTPVEQIEGIVTGGSIKIDGASIIRRTCSSLSLIVTDKDLKIADYHWAFNHKFSVEIGVENIINNNYPEIIWFKQGVFVVNSFSKSETTNGITVSISGQDKMCHLNGTMGGLIPIETDFSETEHVQIDGSIITEQSLLEDIVFSAVHIYGGEKKSNIILNDFDMPGLKLLDYRGSTPLYLFFQGVEGSDYGSVLGMTFDGTTEVEAYEDGSWMTTRVDQLQRYYALNTLDYEYNQTATKIKYGASKMCYVIRLQYGDNAGYQQTPLTYAGGTMMVKSGGAVTNEVLDKVKQVLGEYEYFYDLNGRFIFQKKKTYINELFSPMNGDIVEPMMTISPYSYEFLDKSKIINISYSPNVTNVKNDFIIWGTRPSGALIHARYAIQKKPVYYQTCGTWNADTRTWENAKVFYTEACPPSYYESAVGPELVDWRELIYRMAIDDRDNNQRENLHYQIDQQNIVTAADGTRIHLYPDGITKCEQYYTDMAQFWRYLYDPWFDESSPAADAYKPYQEYYSSDNEIKPGWNKILHTNPTGLVFWFDFLDVGNAPLQEFSVDAVGPRTKVETVSGNASICQLKTPEILFMLPTDDYANTASMSAYSRLYVTPTQNQLFNIAASGTSLISRANELIYEHACCSEGISLTALPIYYLEPNTRIYLEGVGDLIVTSISYNLGHTATMSLTCTKVIQSIY